MSVKRRRLNSRSEKEKGDAQKEKGDAHKNINILMGISQGRPPRCLLKVDSPRRLV